MTVKLVSDLKLKEQLGRSFREAVTGFLISLRASANHRPKSLGALELTLAQISRWSPGRVRGVVQAVLSAAHPTIEHGEVLVLPFRHSA